MRGGHTLTDPALILSRIARLAYYFNSSTSQFKRRWREKWPELVKSIAEADSSLRSVSIYDFGMRKITLRKKQLPAQETANTIIKYEEK